jgi:hypothetical protein
MTIHWKALEEHFLMVPFVFHFNHFQGENVFSEFVSKNLPLKEVKSFHHMFPVDRSDRQLFSTLSRWTGLRSYRPSFDFRHSSVCSSN